MCSSTRAAAMSSPSSSCRRSRRWRATRTRPSGCSSANDLASDFPIPEPPVRTLPACRRHGLRIGVAIGNQVLDLKRARLIESYDINRIMRLAHEPRRALRAAISDGLRRCVKLQPGAVERRQSGARGSGYGVPYGALRHVDEVAYPRSRASVSVRGCRRLAARGRCVHAYTLCSPRSLW